MAMTLICVLAGIVIGLMCRPYAHNWTERQFMYIEIPGELYLRFLKLMIIPLLVSNVILSFGTIQGKISSQLGKVAGFIYLGNNFMAITVAILSAVLICPGGSRLGQNSRNPNDPNNIRNDIANHHYFHEYHDSIARYREYHPMYYHTNNNKPPPVDGTQTVQHVIVSAINQIRQQTSKSNDLPPVRRQESPTTSEQILIDPCEKQKRLSPQVEGEVAYLVKLINTKNHNLPKEINHVSLGTKLPIDVVLDVLRNLFPDSIIGATLQQTRTRLFAPKELTVDRNGSTDPPPNRWPMGHEMINQPNIIGLLAVSVLTGVVLSHMEKAGKPLLDLCSCVSELSLRIGMKAINLAPLCIMFLLISQVSRARDLNSMAGELLMYSMTVILALILHGFVLLPIVYYIVTKKSPFRFLKGMLEALVAAFATSSSSATMALMLNCLTELDLNIVIVRAFGPLGCVFNMNGTAIYEAVGVIFIAQTLGVALPLTSIMLLGLCSAVASLSTSGIPSSGLMNMVIVLNAINLPVLQLSLIYIVDFIIDRFRTVVNVWSGAVVCGLIDHICSEHLFEKEMKPEVHHEMNIYRTNRSSFSNRKNLNIEEKPQIISVTITPPIESSSV